MKPKPIEKNRRFSRRAAKLCISACWYLGQACHARFSRLRGGQQSGRCVVLYYHGIEPDDRERFARQMDALLRRATPVAACETNGLAPGWHAAVTFDDAFSCVIDNAVPELTARRIPYTVFASSGCLGRRPDWMHEPRYVFEPCMTVATAEALRALPTDLATIGSHTVSHAAVDDLHGDELDRELRDSRTALEEALGREVRLLAFPYGRFDDKAVTKALAVGYARVFTVRPSFARMTADERVVGRVNVNPSDWMLEFHLKLRGAYSWQSRVARWRDAWKRKEDHVHRTKGIQLGQAEEAGVGPAAIDGIPGGNRHGAAG